MGQAREWAGGKGYALDDMILSWMFAPVNFLNLQLQDAYVWAFGRMFGRCMCSNSGTSCPNCRRIGPFIS